VDDRALDPDPTSVDHPHLAKPALVRRRQILLDDRRDVPGRERVQIEDVFEGDRKRVGTGRASAQTRGPDITCFCQWS
jgi:hypothetical protein